MKKIIENVRTEAKFHRYDTNTTTNNQTAQINHEFEMV